MSFFQDFFWKSMVFEEMRFQYIDTIYAPDSDFSQLIFFFNFFDFEMTY